MILYAVVARSIDGVILAEATTTSTSTSTIVAVDVDLEGGGGYGGIGNNYTQATHQLIHALVYDDPSLLPAIGNRKTFAANTNANANTNTNTNTKTSTNSKKLQSKTKSKSKVTFTSSRSVPLKGDNKFMSSRTSGLFTSSSDLSAYFRDDYNYDDADDVSINTNWINSLEASNTSEGTLAQAGKRTLTPTSLETYFHVLRGEDILVLGLSDDLDGQARRANYDFLFKVQKQFTLHYTPTKIKNAVAYTYDKPFRATFNNLIHFCNSTKHSQSYSSGTASNTKHKNLGKKRKNKKNNNLLMEESTRVFNNNEKGDESNTTWVYMFILIGFIALQLYLMIMKMKNNNNESNDGGYYYDDDNINNGYYDEYYENNEDENEEGYYNDEHDGDGGR